MDRQIRRTSHAHLNASFDLRARLIPLESVLLAAERSTPSRAPRLLQDPDEVLASRLIDNIKHPRTVPFGGLQIESPKPVRREIIFEMAGSDV